MKIEFLPTIELKEIAEDGTFTGIASVYGIEDLGGDVIDKGAFRKTIAENPTVPVLWQHKSEEVIGEGTLKEWQGKVLIEGKLDLDDPTAQKAYSKAKKKLVKGLSIGFQTVKSTWEEVGQRMIRHIQELKLWEVSIVTFPMLPQAQITRVKSAEDLEARVQQIEADIQALKQGKTTPAPKAEPEPAPAPEPPPPSTEPVEDHSGLSSIVADMLASIPR